MRLLFFRNVAIIGAICALLLALATLLGYGTGNLLWASLAPAYIPMAPSTALSFLVLGGILLLQGQHLIKRPWKYFVDTAALLVAVYGLLVFAFWCLGRPHSFEIWLLPDMGTLEGFPIGHMAPITGALFALAGVASCLAQHGAKHLYGARKRPTHLRDLAGWLSTVILIIVGTLFLGYLYGVPLLYTGNTIPLALSTVLAFAGWSMGQMAALGPTASPVRYFIGRHTAARMLRIFVPLIMASLLIQSALSHFLPLLFGFHVALTTALVAMLSLSVTGWVTCQLARDLGGIIDHTEEELKAAREAFRTTLYSIGDGLITTDATGRIDIMNPVAESLTGWSQAEAQGQPLEAVFRICNEETRAVVDNPAAKVMASGHIVDLANHTVLIARDGVERPISDSGAPIANSHGKIRGVVLVFRDQSQERQAEMALQASRDRYRYLFHANPHPMWIYDMESLAFLEVNQAAVEHYGYSADEFLNMRISDIRPVEDLPRLMQATNRIGQAGIDKAGVWRHIRKDGSIIFVEIIAHTLDWQGRPAELVLALDVTERLTALQELRRTKELLENTFESLGDAVFIVKNPERVIEYCNSAATRIFGYNEAELIGQSTICLYPNEESHVRFGEISVKVLEKSNIFNAEYTMRHKDGQNIHVDATVTKLASEVDRPHPRVISILHDVTRRKAAESDRAKLEEQLLQAQKMEAVGRLAGGIAHDFNNMLGVILGHVDLLLMDSNEQTMARNDLLAIQSAAQSASSLTRQLLTFARRQAIHPEVLNLDQVIGNMQHLLTRLLGEEITLCFTSGSNAVAPGLASSTLWPVKMDPTQIDQILVNLTINSRDAIQGPGKIFINTRNVEIDEAYCHLHPDFTPGHYVLLEHLDTGCGMSKEVLSHIFEPFFTTKDNGKGTGLGLPTVYGIVKQNRGHLNVYSEPGHGTIFRLYFPAIIDVTKRPGPASADKRTDTTLPGGQETLLLVEDEETLLSLGTRMLEQLGYTVLPANHPNAALQLGIEHGQAIDLLVTDIVMPDMSGKDLYESLRAQLPGLRCLYMSGYTADIISNHGVMEEGLFFLQKPFTRRDLAHKVREVLGQRTD